MFQFKTRNEFVLVGNPTEKSEKCDWPPHVCRIQIKKKSSPAVYILKSKRANKTVRDGTINYVYGKFVPHFNWTNSNWAYLEQ